VAALDDCRTRALLNEVFAHDKRFLDDRYLHWLYRSSPSGDVIEVNHDEGLKRCGHYALVPQRWMEGGRVVKYGLSLNTAVSRDARHRGLFVRLAEDSYSLAERHGITTVVGVANASSTPGFLRRLQFANCGALPVRVVGHRRKRHLDQVLMSDRDLISSALDAYNQSLSTIRPTSYCRYWDYEELVWRLNCPIRQFQLHRVNDCLVASTRVRYHGLPIGIIAKIFGTKLNEPVPLAAVASVVNRAHNSVCSMYCGYSPFVDVTDGFEVPSVLRPSPLNLIVRSNGLSQDIGTLQPETFEFLDFDAY